MRMHLVVGGGRFYRYGMKRPLPSWPAAYVLGYFALVSLAAFVQAGRRVSDPECTLCQRCLAACPEGNLRLTVGFPGRDALPASVRAPLEHL